ncbi:MAG: heat-inducible transcriptional repressor HrcA [Gammaproteobacteria bacterium]|nr:heat-inducible transcriptional repressor HrcA [Gammaproteobacteria bacterium]MCI0591366.1 heat-inducible transcriptional repressor HrcA [Gammaproteobacteria bacterium]
MPRTTKDSVLNERALHLFKTLVERYIVDGQPVGSRTLARDAGLDVSPATVRHIMADLEAWGLIRSPHTSAGRMPTVQGYRLFVDTLLTLQELNANEVNRISSEFDCKQDVASLLQTASTMLSNITHLAGVVMLPRTEQKSLRRVEFMRLSGDQVLVILVVNDNEVQNRIIRTARPYSPAELQEAANYLNQSFSGKDLQSVRAAIVKEMQEVHADVNRMMQAVIEMAEKAFAADDRPHDYVLAGQTNLMEIADLSDLEKLKKLFEAFGQKRDILHLLDQAIQARGLQIFIGEESGYEVLDECSVVTSPYTVGDQVVGVLGVIGPTRMAYERVIPIVDVTAKVLGAALNSRH